METAPTMLDNTQQGLTIFGLALGIGGGYARFLHGRVHITRLEPSLTAENYQKDGVNYLLVKMAIKNIGLAHAELCPNAQGLEVRPCVPESANKVDIIRNVLWEDHATIGVMEREDVIDAGETVIEERLIALPPGDYLAVHLGFFVEARKSPWLKWQKKSSVWSTQKIVYLSPQAPSV